MGERISIVVPCLNESAILGRFLESLQPMRTLGHELIVVDGGSHDDSARIAETWADILVVTSRGRAHQMNKGAAAANGEILLFLHSDSSLPPDADQLILQGMVRHRKQWGRFDIVLSGDQWLLTIVGWMMNVRSRLSGIATGDQAMFVRKSLFESVGCFPDIALMEDVALSKNLKHHSWPLCISEKLVTSSRRWEQQGILKTIFLMWRLRLAYALGADPQILASRYRECSSPTRNS